MNLLLTYASHLMFTRDDSGYGLTGYGGYGFVTSHTILTVYYCKRSNLALFNQYQPDNWLNMLTSSKILTVSTLMFTIGPWASSKLFVGDC